MEMSDVWLSLYIVHIDPMFIELDAPLLSHSLISSPGSKAAFWLNIEPLSTPDFNLSPT